MKLFRRATAALLLAGLAMPACAATLIVINARGTAFKPGAKIDSAKPVALKPGELLTVIGPDGKANTLRGPFSGPPMPGGGAAANPRVALAALISSRNARTSSVGVVRGATDAKPLPQPWLIDISRSGERCLRQGDHAVWWRPAGGNADKFVVSPIDRSWRADFAWKSGESQMDAPPLAKFEGQTIFIIKANDQEYAVSVNLIPADLDNDFILASWMLEKGCIQQADALLHKIQASQGPEQAAGGQPQS